MMRRYNFYFEFLEQGRLPHFFQGSGSGTGNAAGVAALLFIPHYIPHSHLALKPSYKALYLPYHQGFYVDLSAYPDAEGYLRSQIGGRNLKKMRRLRRRLSGLGELRLDVYHGEMESETCTQLMNTMKSMISERFDQLGLEHTALQRWTDYESSILPMIKLRRASLMVLTQDNTIIGMGLNYHFNGVMDSAITTFKKGYEKYGIGQLMLWEKLRWAYANQWSLMDLRWGDLPHKRKLANRIIRYRAAVVYPKNAPLHFILALGLWLALRLKVRLKSA